MLAQAFAWSTMIKIFENNEKAPFSSCVGEAHEKNEEKSLLASNWDLGACKIRKK